MLVSVKVFVIFFVELVMFCVIVGKTFLLSTCYIPSHATFGTKPSILGVNAKRT